MQMHFDADKVAQLLQNKKAAKNWSGFHPKDNHRGLLVGTAILFDDSGIAIPGMTAADRVAHSNHCR